MNQHKVIISSMTMTCGKDVLNIDINTVSSMLITHDYDARLAPIFEITMNLANDTLKRIYASNGKNVLKLELQQKTYDSKEVVSKKTILKKSFDVIIKDDMTDFRINSKTYNEENTKKDMDQLSPISFYLIDLKTINMMNKVLSFNPKGATISSCLSYAVSARGFGTGSVVASPPINGKVYGSLPIEMGDLNSNIKYMNELHGVYNSDHLLYLAFEYLYILDKSNPNVILDEAGQYGNITFQLLNKESTGNSLIGSIDDAKKKIHLVNINELPHVEDVNSFVNAMEFSTIMTVNASTGVVDKLTLNTNSSKMKTIETVNSLLKNQEKNRLKSEAKKVSMKIAESSIDIYRPYKKYYFSFGPEYAAFKMTEAFRLSYISHELTGSDGVFTTVSNIILKSM